MNIEKEKLVILNEDEKKTALKSLSDIYNTTGELFNQIKKDELTEEMKDCLFSLIESHMSEASKIFKYDSQATARMSERHADIRQANQRIHELEKKLADNTQVSGLKELLYDMHNALYKWWEKQGFNLVTDDEFGGYGYKGRFCLDTSLISFVSTQPVTQEKERKSKLEQMIDAGYEFVKEGRREYTLLDTQKNRELITELLKSKFKSLNIVKWENYCLHNKEEFKLRSFECYIRDLNELKELIEEMKQVSDEDED